MAFMSLALIAGSVEYPNLSIIFVWSALSFGVVALGYAGLGSKVFGKQEDGTISLGLKVINLPFLLFTWSIWHVYRLLSKEDPFNKIGDDLVIGRRLLSSEIIEDYDHYVDLTAEFEEPLPIRSSPSYHCFPILDASTPSVEDLYSATEQTQVGKTYIHCAQGHGRTGLFALALLHRRGKVNSVAEGISILKSLRPAINLNTQQEQFMSHYLTKVQNKPLHLTPDSPL